METTIPTLVSILDAPEDKVDPIMVAVSNNRFKKQSGFYRDTFDTLLGLVAL